MTIETLQHTSWLELRQGTTSSRTVALTGELTVGRDIGLPDVDGHLSVSGDTSISRLNAILMRKPLGWCVQAPGSTNGLFVNGNRLADGAVHLLARNDEIRIGERTVLIFHSLEPGTPDRSRTQSAHPVPDLTGTERKILMCLCLPLVEGDTRFTPPASVATIAAQLFVTQSAVKQHLGRLYLKFETPNCADRRVELANDALERGAIRRADLEAFHV
jgi:pSer/pThr/pTyr-binding forkhead associated (FHA) protein